jgi:hypothetical protein
MVRPFDDTTRRNIAELCAAFTRAHLSGPAPALKRAAVAFALTSADAGGGTAFLLTRRAAARAPTAANGRCRGGRCDQGESQAEARYANFTKSSA